MTLQYKAKMPTVNYRSHAPGQLVKIPNQFKSYVSGPGGDNLRNVSTLTGTEVSRLGDHQLYVTGEKKRVQHAEYLLRSKVVSFTNELPTSGKFQTLGQMPLPSSP